MYYKCCTLNHTNRDVSVLTDPDVESVRSLAFSFAYYYCYPSCTLFDNISGQPVSVKCQYQLLNCAHKTQGTPRGSLTSCGVRTQEQSLITVKAVKIFKPWMLNDLPQITQKYFLLLFCKNATYIVFLCSMCSARSACVCGSTGKEPVRCVALLSSRPCDAGRTAPPPLTSRSTRLWQHIICTQKGGEMWLCCNPS